MILTRDDRLRAKSGGPVLHVVAVYSNRRLTCSWMDEMGQRHEGMFRTDSLRKIEPFTFDRPARRLEVDEE